MSIKALLTRLISKLSEPFITRTYTVSNLSASTWYSNYQINVGVSGYTPIAFRSITLNQADKHLYWFYFVGNIANIGIALNQNSGTIANTQITIIVTYIKDDLLS